MKKTLVMLLCAASIVLIGCKKDEPVKPEPTPTPTPTQEDVMFRVYSNTEMLQYIDITMEYTHIDGSNFKEVISKTVTPQPLNETIDKYIFEMVKDNEQRGKAEAVFLGVVEKNVTSWNTTVKISYSPKDNAPYDENVKNTFITGMYAQTKLDLNPTEAKGDIFNGIYCSKEKITALCDMINANNSYNFRFKPYGN